MVVCEECAQIDFSRIDWEKVEEAGKKANALGITDHEARRKFYRDNAPSEFDRLQLACKTCTLESVASKLKAAENQNIESLAPCSHCGKPVLVKHELAASIKRLVAYNQGYFFDVGADEREIVIRIKKRGASRVTEPNPNGE